MNLSYIIKLRNSLKKEFRHMPLFKNGSAIIVEDESGKILLEERTDREMWCIPGGLQELGETFEETAVRELKEETGLVARIEDFKLIKVVSGENRKNSYPNGDIVYNNTILFLLNKYTGSLNSDYEEITDNNKEFLMQKESKNLKFFNLDNLPQNLMDKDLINVYITYKRETRGV